MSLELFVVVISDNFYSVSISSGAELLELITHSAMIWVRHVRARFVVNIELSLALIDHCVHALSQFLIHTNFILRLYIVELGGLILFIKLIAAGGDQISLTASANAHFWSK